MKPAATLAVIAATLALPVQAAAPGFDTAAPVAFMKDMSSGAVLFARDADRLIPPASMAKMMKAHVAFDLIDKGELDPTKMLTVSEETWKRWHGPAAGSTMFLSVNQQVSVENLLHGIVTLSGNDACVVLAEGISGTEQAFVGLMNKQAAALGMKNSRFGNSNGWPDSGVTYTTARDLATLAEATIVRHPKLYKQYYAQPAFTWGATMGGAPISQPNRNPILGKVAGADGLKTGHTDEAGYGFTGSAAQEGRRLVMVLAGLSSFNERIAQSTSFMNWGFRAWQARPLYAKGRRVAEARVQGGGEDVVGLVAPRDLGVTIPAGLGSDIKVRVVYQGPLTAPIAKGQHVADLVVSTPDTPPQKMPLLAAAAVEKAGFFGRVWTGLTSLFA